MKDLKASRNKIDNIDKQIVELFEERMKAVEYIADYKIKNNKPVLDLPREKEKIDSLMSLTSNYVNKQGIKELFKQVMASSRKLQYSLMPQDKEDVFKEISALNIFTDTKVAYFGEEGSYTQQAMEENFSSKVITFKESTFRTIMEMISNKEVDYGVLPIENASTGGIGDIYDLLVQFDNYIIKEHIINIEHALLGLQDAKLSDIKRVYSHPQALQQTSSFLEEHNEIKQVQCFSTSYGAKKVLEDDNIEQGAIASLYAAKHYNLKVLEKNINNSTTNQTRFIIISNKMEYIKNANKISVCFELPHESGSLYDILSHISYNNLNMTNIESRPIVNKNFKYRFFVDFEGCLKDSGVHNAIKGMKIESSNFKILGAF